MTTPNKLMTDAELRHEFLCLTAATPRPGVDILEAELLTHRDLSALARGETFAVRVRNFLPPEVCAAVKERLYALHFTAYDDPSAIGIKRASAKNLFDCAGDRRCRAYWDTARQMRREMRGALQPLLVPTDVIQTELDAAWSAGCEVLKVDGEMAHVGMLRLFEQGGAAETHVDRARRDFDHPATSNLTNFAVNLYLDTGRGGRLSLWRIAPSDALYDAARHRAGPTYAVRAELLPQPDVVLEPQPGDLIVFNADRIHAVSPVESGRRLTVSLFAGYAGDQLPLRIFS